MWSERTSASYSTLIRFFCSSLSLGCDLTTFQSLRTSSWIFSDHLLDVGLQLSEVLSHDLFVDDVALLGREGHYNMRQYEK